MRNPRSIEKKAGVVSLLPPVPTAILQRATAPKAILGGVSAKYGCWVLALSFRRKPVWYGKVVSDNYHIGVHFEGF